jgi:hypothetical protein
MQSPMTSWSPWLCLALCSPCNTSAARFEVEGELSYKVWDGPKTLLDLRREFTVTVNGCEWLIKIWNPTGASTNGILYSQAGYDGTNIYHVRAFDTNAQTPPRLVIGDGANTYTNELNVQLIKLKNSAVGRVLPGDFPLQPKVDPFVVPIWLGYGSGCWFAKVSDSLLRPAYMVDEALDASTHRVRGEWRTLDKQSGLPAWVAYFNDGKTFKRPGLPLGTADPPYDKGFTNAIYEVMGSTNVDGWVLPTSFRLTTFGPKPGGQTPDELLPITEIAATARRVRRSLRSDPFVPPLPGNTFVTDGRTQGGPISNGYVYLSTNGTWLDKAAVKRLAGRTQTSAAARRVVVGLLVLVTGIFTVLILRHYGTRFGSSAGHRDGVE